MGKSIISGAACMKIILYQDKYKQEIIDLILHIQNDETKINLSIEEQPDLLNVSLYYEKSGGAFWIAVEKDEVNSYHLPPGRFS